MPLILDNHRYDRRNLGHLMTQRRGIISIQGGSASSTELRLAGHNFVAFFRRNQGSFRLRASSGDLVGSTVSAGACRPRVLRLPDLKQFQGHRLTHWQVSRHGRSDSLSSTPAATGQTDSPTPQSDRTEPQQTPALQASSHVPNPVAIPLNATYPRILQIPAGARRSLLHYGP